MKKTLLITAIALLVGCPKAPDTAHGGAQATQGKAQSLLAAASGFGNVKHEYLLDPQSAMVPGRCVEKSEGGGYGILPTKCAEQKSSTSVDAATVDFSYIGVAVDQHLVSADADLLPMVNAGASAEEHKISLVAIAFVRDLDPQFFGASDEVQYAGSACSCGRATHFVGSVKMGGLISYEMRVKSAELRGHALDFIKARLATSDSQITQTQVGGLEVEGLEGVMKGETKPLSFKVKSPVPIAYAVYPLSDVCKFAFPAPEVTPQTVEFGDVPYGREEKKILHVVNRSPLELRASLGGLTFQLPALGSTDVPIAWTPDGQALGCETQTREETLSFYPRDNDAPITPKTQTVTVSERVRTGKATFRRHEHVDSGTGRKPDYAATKREFTCPTDYAPMGCHTEKPQCGDGSCVTDGYAVNAEPTENGCRFSCKGPEGLIPGLSSNFCRFDAVMDCRLRCK